MHVADISRVVDMSATRIAAREEPPSRSQRPTVGCIADGCPWVRVVQAVLVEPVGSRQALRMVAACFGIAHFYGIPYGVIGVALAWFMGWILAIRAITPGGS
jgi:hypothetical protein